MSKINIGIELPGELKLKEFILVGKSYEDDEFYDVVFVSGKEPVEEGQELIPADPVTVAGLKTFMLKE